MSNLTVMWWSELSKKQKKTLRRIIVSALLLGAGLLIPFPEEYPVIRLLYMLIPYFLVGFDVLKNAVTKTGRGQLLDEQFLMAIATVGAFAIGEYPEGVAVMLFYQIGEFFQSVAVGKSRRSIAALVAQAPDEAVRITPDGKEETVEPDELSVGDIVLVRPGEKIPVDGVIIDGTTDIDNSPLTGESVPVSSSSGDNVYSGGVNLSGVIKIKVTAPYEESAIARILQLVEESSDKKSRTEVLITRFAKVYTPVVVAFAILLFLGCFFLTPLGLADSIRRALVFLVISCPCALVVSIPLSFFGGIGAASKRGILIKGSNYLETLAAADTVVFDKTGTLTRGTFSVTDIRPANGCAKEELLALAAVCESHSTHPVAKAVVAAGISLTYRETLSGAREIPGKGIRANVGDSEVLCGNRALLEEEGVKDLPESDGTAVYIAKDGLFLGYITASDTLKTDAAKAISDLKKLGVKRTVLLSGDHEKAAEKISREAGLDEFRAELLPGDKVKHIEDMLSKGHPLLFVGDGINDAPALTRADAGIAMGALGTDAAIEAADVVLMDDSLSKLPEAIRIARKTCRIAKENVFFSLFVKLLIMVLGALGFAGMKLAIFGDVGVLILAILNALRCMRVPEA